MDMILDSAKIIQKSGTFVLYLVAIYWSTEAVMKYWSEPAVTSIQYTFGDADQKIQFPALTFCPLYDFYPNIPYYVKVLSDECQLPFQQECVPSTWHADGYCDDSVNSHYCKYDGGDCCGPDLNTQYCQTCQCFEPEIKNGSHYNTRDYSGESFSDLIGECIKLNPSINLRKVMDKLMFSRDEYIQVTLLENKNIIENWEESKEQLWTDIFHPDFGYCYIFDLSRVEKFDGLSVANQYHIVISLNYTTFSLQLTDFLHFNLWMHEPDDLASNLHLSRELIFMTENRIRLSKSKVVQADPPLQRLPPCTKESKSLCHARQLHLLLEENYGCEMSVFYSASHFTNTSYQFLPECTNDVIRKVLSQMLMFYFTEIIGFTLKIYLCFSFSLGIE